MKKARSMHHAGYLTSRNEAPFTQPFHYHDNAAKTDESKKCLSEFGGWGSAM